jgi:hypothetical protein
MTPQRGRIIAAAALLALSACFDTSPIDYTPPPTPEAGPPMDGGAAPDAASLIQACGQCMMSSTCSEALAPCAANTRCNALAKCLLNSYCMTLNVADLAHVPQCALDCSTEAGIEGQQDPALFLYLQVIFCAQNPMKCGPVCDVPGVVP